MQITVYILKTPEIYIFYIKYHNIQIKYYWDYVRFHSGHNPNNFKKLHYWVYDRFNSGHNPNNFQIRKYWDYDRLLRGHNQNYWF